ncbi:MAG: hypothetical protein KA731_02725 [Candidatus Moranbacteria bacterium]|nr:hypothetical protein [Candidatus Moranbacteria bacterium]MBP6034139.1 hypothetical protein [Candidatus Moranbacteria bacterium]
MTSGQEKQLVRFVADAAESAAKQVVADADFLWKDGAQLVIERGGELKTAIEQATVNALKQLSSRYPVFAETRLLKPVAQATVPARTKPFNVAEFYQTGPGLYVYDTFADRLELNARQAVDSAPERPYVASLLKANASDGDIRKELPETHLSTLEGIAGLIEAQPNGKSGFLLNNGYANIFYVEGKNGEVFAVGVRWDSGRRRWRVRNWELGGFGDWDADRQVLCPGTAAL